MGLTFMALATKVFMFKWAKKKVLEGQLIRQVVNQRKIQLD